MSTVTRPAAKRRSRTHRSLTSRLAAIASASMAGAVLGELAASGAQGYALLLAGSLAVGALVASARMWHCNCFESRLAVLVLAGLIVGGQVLVAVVGEPGASAVAWTPSASLVVLLALAAVALVVLDARERPVPAEHPYAL